MLPWPLPDRLDLRDALVTAWSTDRGYHDLVHLTEVLDRLTELGGGADRELLVAAWFHDAVYDGLPGAEERSALLAERVLDGTADLDVAEVARLVRLTEHHRPEPDDLRGCLLVDADLAILAAGPERYAAYVAGVRAEYAQVPDEAFRQGRSEILADLLAKPTLFHSAAAQDRWETAARANLRRELADLTGSSSTGTGAP